MIIIITVLFIILTLISGISIFLYNKNEAKQKADLENKLKADLENKLKAEDEARLKADLENKLKAEDEARLKEEDINYIIQNNDDKFYSKYSNFIINQNKFLIESVKPLPSLDDIDKYDTVFETIQKGILLNNNNMLINDKNKIKFINQEIIFE